MAMAGSVVATLRRGRSDSAGSLGARPSGTGAPAAGAAGMLLTGVIPANAPVACNDAATAHATARAISDQIQQHDDRVLLILRVVIRANAVGPEAETTIEPQRRGVRAPNLERGDAAFPPAADVDDVRQQPRRVARSPF